MAVDVSRLDPVTAFAGLSPDERERVAAASNPVELPQGSVLAPQGDYGYSFFIIEDGTVDVTDGDTRLAELGRGDFFGEIGLLITERRTATVTATSPIRALTIFDRDFRRLCADVPAFEQVLREAMAERLGANR
jgi:cAMP-dependent protein kinase regulator